MNTLLIILLLLAIPVAALVIGLIYALGRLPFLKGLPFAVRMAAPGALEAAGFAALSESYRHLHCSRRDRIGAR